MGVAQIFVQQGGVEQGRAQAHHAIVRPHYLHCQPSKNDSRPECRQQAKGPGQAKLARASGALQSHENDKPAEDKEQMHAVTPELQKRGAGEGVAVELVVIRQVMEQHHAEGGDTSQ